MPLLLWLLGVGCHYGEYSVRRCRFAFGVHDEILIAADEGAG